MKRGEKRSTKRNLNLRSKSSGSVRIISGRFRGRKLPVLDIQGLRPTTDKNREMLFSWLMADIQDARCLDVFAGSGGLGFEALSRYAKSCTFIELDKGAANKIADNIKLLALPDEQAKIIQGNSLHKLADLSQSFELIFLDPPFNQNLLPHTIERIVEHSLLAAGGVIYIECEGQSAEYPVPDNWQLIKEKRSTQILARVYLRTH